MGNKNKSQNAIRQNINDLVLSDLEFKDFIKKDILMIPLNALIEGYETSVNAYNILKNHDCFDISKIEKSKTYYDFIENVYEFFKLNELTIHTDYSHGYFLQKTESVELVHDVAFMYLADIEKSPYKNWIKKGIWYLLECGFDKPWLLRDIIGQKEEMTIDDEYTNREDYLKDLTVIKEAFEECDNISKIINKIHKVKVNKYKNIEKSKAPYDLKLWFKTCQLLYDSGFNLEMLSIHNNDDDTSLSERYVFLESDNSYSTEIYSEHMQMCYENTSFDLFKRTLITKDEITVINDDNLSAFLLLIFDINFETGMFLNLHSKQNIKYEITLQTMENLVNLSK
jgi:hypothetical protein